MNMFKCTQLPYVTITQMDKWPSPKQLCDHHKNGHFKGVQPIAFIFDSLITWEMTKDSEAVTWIYLGLTFIFFSLAPLSHYADQPQGLPPRVTSLFPTGPPVFTFNPSSPLSIWSPSGLSMHHMWSWQPPYADPSVAPHHLSTKPYILSRAHTAICYLSLVVFLLFLFTL